MYFEIQLKWYKNLKLKIDILTFSISAKKKTERTEQDARDAGHIMLSYNWGNQKILLQVQKKFVTYNMHCQIPVSSGL